MPEIPPHPPQHPLRLVVPSRSDSLLRHFTEVLGGPLGKRTAPGIVAPHIFTVERVLILLTVGAALLSIAVKQYCRTNGWESPAQFYSTCYSDFPELFRNRGIGDGTLPIFTAGASLEYPVLIGFLAALTALLTPGEGYSAARSLAYFDINATLIAAVWIVTVIATARMAGRRPWDAAMVALAPGIVLAGVINWDMWAAGLLAMGMLFFARNRLVPAGILIGLAVATKLYPVIFLGAIFLLGLRTGRWRPFIVTTAAAAATWGAVNLPVSLLNPAAWESFGQFSVGREAGYGSAWFAYNLVAGQTGSSVLEPRTINLLFAGLFVLSCLGIAAVAVTAERRPRLAQLLFLGVAAFILCNKVYSPQFVVWLIPLIALARPRWRDYLVWQGAEVLHWAATWMYLGRITSNGPSQHNIDTPYYVLAVILHMLATAYLMARVIWDIYQPAMDPVRRQGMDDPQGGPFREAPDARYFPLRRGGGATSYDGMHALLDKSATEPRDQRAKGNHA